MVHSRLPVPSLLGLFSALLMLTPELLMGIPEELSDLPVTDPGVQTALAFAVETYNRDREDSTNYFKMLRVLRVQSQEMGRDEYRITVDLVKTTCKKRVGRKMRYKRIQRCKELEGNQETPNCYFVVIPRSPPAEMNLSFTDCT